MAEPHVPSTDQDDRARGTTAVWVFFVITLVVSATIVYVIGDRLDNPDAAILTVLVPSTVAIGVTAGTSGWIGVRSLLRLRGEGRDKSGSYRLNLAAPSASHPPYRHMEIRRVLSKAIGHED